MACGTQPLGFSMPALPNEQYSPGACMVTTVTSCGAVNAAFESLTGIGGLIPFVDLGYGESVFGGVGAGLYTMVLQGANQPAQYSLVITGALLSVLPLIALFLSLQRYWRVDLGAGAVKG